MIIQYSCSLCNYTNSRKDKIKKHFNNKNKCGNGSVSIIESEIEGTLSCEVCDKTFKVTATFTKHQQSCKREAETKKQLAELQAKLNSSIIQNGNNNVIDIDNSTNNIVIHLNSYKTVDKETIYKYCEEAISRVCKSIPYIIKQVHFNEDSPENHNILVTNLGNKVAKVFMDNKWVSMVKEEIIDEIIMRYEELLEDWSELSEQGQDKIELYNEIKLKDGTKLKNKIRNDVKFVMYDNHEMVLATKNLTKN